MRKWEREGKDFLGVFDPLLHKWHTSYPVCLSLSFPFLSISPLLSLLTVTQQSRGSDP